MFVEKVHNSYLIHKAPASDKINYNFSFSIQLLISVIINWLICGVLTHTGMLTDDPTNAEYTTRTDARGSVVEDSSWFNIPYPGNTNIAQDFVKLQAKQVLKRKIPRKQGKHIRKENSRLG